MIDKNFLDYALGIEYGFTKNLRASVAWAGTRTGINQNYQDELSYSLNTNGFGGGLGIRISPMIDVNIGGLYTIYSTASKTFTHTITGTDFEIPVTETYKKTTWVAAVGVDLHF
jgi:long-subunit fatty acid transport protein